MEKVEVHRKPDVLEGNDQPPSSPRSSAFRSPKNASLKTLSDSLPTQTQLQYAVEDYVYDSNGQKIKFRELLEKDKKTLVVFVRHFRCALCQDFLVYITLGGKLTPETLAENDTKMIVIGCGGWKFVRKYKRTVDLPYEVYANPSTSLYKALGMGNFYGVDKNVKSHYTAKGWYNMVWRSILKGIKMGNFFVRAGDQSQLGGEFVLVRTPDEQIEALFAHRMKTISDHSTAETLVKTLASFPSGQQHPQVVEKPL